MPNLNDALVFERHILLILTSIIVMNSFISIRADLPCSTLILGIILLSIVVWDLKVLLLWYLILIVLNVPRLVFNRVLSHQGVVGDESFMSLIELFHPLSLLLLLLLLDLKHSGQIKKLPSTRSFNLLNLMGFFQLSHEVFFLVLSRAQEIPTVHMLSAAHSTHHTSSSLLGHIDFICWKRSFKETLDSLVVVLSHVLPAKRRLDAVIS